MQQLSGRFAAQEAGLKELEAHLIKAAQLISADEDGDSSDSEQDSLLLRGLQEACAEALSATRERRTGQSFGDMQTDGNSMAMDGIVGPPQAGVEQTFGSITTTNYSKAFRGQMDPSSFAVMFGPK